MAISGGWPSAFPLWSRGRGLGLRAANRFCPQPLRLGHPASVEQRCVRSWVSARRGTSIQSGCAFGCLRRRRCARFLVADPTRYRGSAREPKYRVSQSLDGLRASPRRRLMGRGLSRWREIGLFRPAVFWPEIDRISWCLGWKPGPRGNAGGRRDVFWLFGSPGSSRTAGFQFTWPIPGTGARLPWHPLWIWKLSQLSTCGFEAREVWRV